MFPHKEDLDFTELATENLHGKRKILSVGEIVKLILVTKTWMLKLPTLGELIVLLMASLILVSQQF